MPVKFTLLKEESPLFTITDFAIQDISYETVVSGKNVYFYASECLMVIKGEILSLKKFGFIENEKEFKEVRELIHWALLTEKNKDCYLNLEIEITNTTGNIIRKERYNHVYVTKYHEIFKSDGVFFLLELRERIEDENTLTVEK